MPVLDVENARVSRVGTSRNEPGGDDGFVERIRRERYARRSCGLYFYDNNCAQRIVEIDQTIEGAGKMMVAEAQSRQQVCASGRDMEVCAPGFSTDFF